MNGGMEFPPNFKRLDGYLTGAWFAVARRAAAIFNRLIPGKQLAAVLLVANDRTRRALPGSSSGSIVRLVENGIDLSLWSPPNKERASGPVRFIYIGRLIDLKAVDLLIEAFGRIEPHAGVTLAIVGDGPLRQHLEYLARDLIAKGSVQFTGWLSQSLCAARLQEADALVLPSVWECGGAVVLEAMASARPVIALDWGGPADYVDPTCGILIAPTSRGGIIRDLADAMARLAASEELREAMGRAGRERAVRFFDWESKVTRILEIYDQVLRKRDLPVARGAART
jgi:glycosyltransferase involved in cell wall biosynthesis